jgi:thiamine-phosphate pyrophosphorylase
LGVTSASTHKALGSRRGLYAIVDPAFCRGRDPLAIAEAVLEAGCAVLQLRAKHAIEAELETLARQMLSLCRSAQVPLVINDRPELARRIGAAGVHLGQTDMPLEAARLLLGSEVAIGISTHDLRQARDAQARGADLIGYGPVFATRTKDVRDPVVGVEGLREICQTLTIPVVAIGGITPENVALVARSGAAMAAAIGAICGADDPRAAAQRMHAAFTR